MMSLRVAALASGVTTLGPGRRVALWLQGCGRRCSGCMSPETWSRRAGELRGAADVLGDVVSLAPGHLGLTVSGGEPFEQAEALAHLLAGVHQHTDLDVLVFSGYTIDEIQRGSPTMKYVLSLCDVLIDGVYDERAPTRKLWRGSANQQLHVLSQRALRYADLDGAEYADRRPMQLLRGRSGVRLVGIPERGFDPAFRSEVLQRGLLLERIKETR